MILLKSIKWYNSAQEHQLASFYSRASSEIILHKSIKWHNSAEAILLQHGLLSRCGPDIIQREPYSQPPIFLTLSEILFTVIVIVSNWALLQAVEKSKTIESKDLARAFIFLPFIFRENLKSTIKCKVADESSRAVSNKSTWLPFDQFNSAISLISVRSCIYKCVQISITGTNVVNSVWWADQPSPKHVQLFSCFITIHCCC